MCAGPADAVAAAVLIRLCSALAPAELYFSDVFWPDFGEAELASALRDYAHRDRRFGGRRRGAASGSSAES